MNNDKDNNVDYVSSILKKSNNTNVGYERNYKKRVWKIDYLKYLMGQSYENFLSSVNNQVTRENYRKKLYYMCEKLGMTTEELYKYSDELSGKTKKKTIELENKVRDIINNFKNKNTLKEYDHYAGVIYLEYYAFKRFCEANRINLNFKWLKNLMPKIDNKGKDKGYTKKQITDMLIVADFRSRLIILIFATSAMREGALANLRMQDITTLPEGAKDDEIEGAKFVIYRGDKDEDFAFITPECYKALIAYLDARRELGENITPSSPIILKRLPRNRKKGWTVTECISSSTIGKIVVNVAVRAGIRKLSDEYTHSVRYTNKITTGFRKFCETTMIGARNKDGTHKMNPYFADRLLSHKKRGDISTTKHYDESDIFEDYKHVIPELTFSKEEEYKVKYEQAEVRLESTQRAEEYIKQKETEVNELTIRLAKMEEKQDRLLSVIAKESIVGKPILPKSQLDLIFSGELDAIPFHVADGDGKDIKAFTIGKKIEAIRRNYPEQTKRFKDKKSKNTNGKSKITFLEPPDVGFLPKEQWHIREEWVRNHKKKTKTPK